MTFHAITGSMEAETHAAMARCADITARSGSNFYLAFLPLPAERRAGIFAVYAFCRVVDDLVDEPLPGEDPRRELDAWRERVTRAIRGEVHPGDHPVAIGLAATSRKYPVRESDLHAIIDGVSMDLDRARTPTRDELSLYCERVAGRVGCACLPVFGASSRMRPFALALGEAFQLTNILRDVPRDAAIGRIYLPAEDLARHGASESDLLAGRSTPAIRAVMRDTGERARALFHEAEALVDPRERKSLFPALIMMSIYRRLLDTLFARNFDAWTERPALPSSVKALLALGVYARDGVLETW